MENVLEARGLTKYFPAMKALDNIDFDLRAGEVHILLGENGAGKSTLAKCLLGAYMPEEGEIFLKGEKLHLLSAKDALEKGIAGRGNRNCLCIPSNAGIQPDRRPDHSHAGRKKDRDSPGRREIRRGAGQDDGGPGCDAGLCA